MGQYRFSCYFRKQIGLLLKYDEFTIEIDIPFISIHIAITEDAKGYNIFNTWKN